MKLPVTDCELEDRRSCDRQSDLPASAAEGGLSSNCFSAAELCASEDPSRDDPPVETNHNKKKLSNGALVFLSTEQSLKTTKNGCSIFMTMQLHPGSENSLRETNEARALSQEKWR